MSGIPKAHGNELPPPPGAALDPSAGEVLGASMVRRSLQVSLIRAFDDPAAWGIMLFDIARRAARSFADQDGGDADQAMIRIRAAWDAETADPSDPGGTSPVS